MVCDDIVAKNARYILSNVTNSLTNVKTLAQLRDAVWTAAHVLMSDSIQNCKNFVNERLSSSTVQQTIVTTDCFSVTGTQEWNIDPCCNPFFTWSNVSCLPRNVTVSLNLLNSTVMNTTDSCSSPGKSGQLLSDYSRMANTAEDPIKGLKFVLFTILIQNFDKIKVVPL